MNNIKFKSACLLFGFILICMNSCISRCSDDKVFTIPSRSNFQRPRINFPNKHLDLDINKDEFDKMFDFN